jgi:two-component system, OmpR family, sensor histidine kinase CpxA
MKIKSSLPLKISLLAFFNFILLGLVFLLFARVQFHLDAGFFLFAPARDRMLSVSRLLALQLPEEPASQWSESLARYSKIYSAELYLFDNVGQQLGGPPVRLPGDFRDFLVHRRDRHDTEAARHIPRPVLGSPPIFVSHEKNLNDHWVGIPIPIWSSFRKEPVHGTLIWRFSSPWTNPFFFDYRPWLAIILAIILIFVACWLPLVRGLTRTISQMTRATGQIAEGHFEIALSTRRGDELGQLSESINRMAHRLSDFVHGQRRFLSDIAHELCSPIARMQVALGILEQRAEGKSADYVTDVGEELNHMSGLINELLSFSKAQIGAAETQLTRVNVAEVARRVLEREGSEQARIETHIEEDLSVLAQPDYLYRSLANLVRNAVRYAGGGPIRVSAKNGKDMVSISVADQGPGLPAGELGNVFKPFYRPEFARQRETGGSGLGLAIVKSCVEACGGAVSARNRSPHGLEVEMLLPAAGPSNRHSA